MQERENIVRWSHPKVEGDCRAWLARANEAITGFSNEVNGPLMSFLAWLAVLAAKEVVDDEQI